VKIEAWQRKNNDARQIDKQALDELMDQLGTDQQRLIDVLSKLQSANFQQVD